MAHRARQGLLAAVLLVLVGLAVAACGQQAATSATDDEPVIKTTPRSTARASSLVVVGYANRQNRALVERAVAILRRHGELATQRRAEIQRLRLKQLEQIGVIACDSSCPRSDDILGTAKPDQGLNPELVDCAVVLNMPLIQATAKDWEAAAADITALVLVHEQEHCLRTPDDRETPAVAAERRLAQKLRNPHLIAFVKSYDEKLDASGHWKD